LPGAGSLVRGHHQKEEPLIYQSPDFRDRLTSAAKARNELLTKFRCAPGPDDPPVRECAAARQATIRAREARAAERVPGKREREKPPRRLRSRPIASPRLNCKRRRRLQSLGAKKPSWIATPLALRPRLVLRRTYAMIAPQSHRFAAQTDLYSLQQSLMTWFVLRLFADRSFSPDHLAKAIVIIRPETFIASRHSFVACRQ
jgi:Family of unknown function (DUF6481)